MGRVWFDLWVRLCVAPHPVFPARNQLNHLLTRYFVAEGIVESLEAGVDGAGTINLFPRHHGRGTSFGPPHQLDELGARFGEFDGRRHVRELEPLAIEELHRFRLTHVGCVAAQDTIKGIGVERICAIGHADELIETAQRVVTWQRGIGSPWAQNNSTTRPYGVGKDCGDLVLRRA
jgi:hypothetical protein